MKLDPAGVYWKIISLCMLCLIGNVTASPLRSRDPVPVFQQLADVLYQKIERRFLSTVTSDPILAVALEADNSIVGRGARVIQEIERLLLYRMENGVSIKRALSVGTGRQEALVRAHEQGAEWLLRCVVGVEQGTIHVTAELTPLRMRFWEWLLNPVPRGAKEHLFVSAPVDQEVRLLLGKSRAQPAQGGWRFTPILLVPHRILDVGMGDLDADGETELVLLYESAVEVYALSDDRPRRLATYGLDHIPEALIRLRNAQGSLVVFDFNADGRSELFVKLLDKRSGEILSWTGAQLVSLRELGLVPFCVYRQARRPIIVFGKSEPGTNRYIPELEFIDVNQSVGRKLVLPWSFQALRCMQPDDGGIPWMLIVDVQGNLYQMRGEVEPRLVQSGIGVGVGVANLDGNHEPELILSDSVWPGEPDSITVLSGGNVVWEIKQLPGSVVAVSGDNTTGRAASRVAVAVVDLGETASRVYLLQK